MRSEVGPDPKQRKRPEDEESWDVQFDGESGEDVSEPSIPQKPIGMDGR